MIDVMKCKSRLQAIIDSNPFGAEDHATREAKELLERFGLREPVPGHEPDDYATVPQAEIGKEDV